MRVIWDVYKGYTGVKAKGVGGAKSKGGSWIGPSWALSACFPILQLRVSSCVRFLVWQFPFTGPEVLLNRERGLR